MTLGGDGAWVTLGHARGADAKKPFLSPKCAYHNHVLDPAGGVPVWAYNWECVPGVPFAFLACFCINFKTPYYACEHWDCISNVHFAVEAKPAPAQGCVLSTGLAAAAVKAPDSNRLTAAV